MGHVPVRVHVVAAAIFDDQGRVLISQRPAHVHQGGLWEFPGGKLEEGESAEQALHRELSEELGIEVRHAQPLITVPYSYPEHHVRLDVWQVTEFEGDARGCEGQPLAWVSSDQLDEYRFPEANSLIIHAIQLPALYMITGKPADQPELFLTKLEKALQRGIRLVQLRAKGLHEEALLVLARQAVSLTRQYGAKLLLNGSPALLEKLPELDGIQLSSDRLTEFKARPIALQKLLGVSCHSPEQLRHAELIGADFALLSPVQATKSHPGDEPLGWDCFSQWVAETSIPVYALGGMDVLLEGEARQRGGQGIAAISALWES